MLRFYSICALILAGVLALWRFAPDRDEAASKPFFVTYHLAGVHLMDKHKWPGGNDFSGVYDANQHYSIRDGDGPDGCEYWLRLRPSSFWNSDRAELREIFPDVHLTLKTGRGVAIGDTMAEVKKKIGAPSTINGDDYFYIHRPLLYRAHYSFKNGHLSEIEFHQMRRATKKHPRDGCL